MNRQERLRELARQMYDAVRQDKEVSDLRAEIREEFLKLIKTEQEVAQHLLPIKSIEVPFKFWDTTGLSKDEFVASRFPGWIVEHIERNIERKTDIFVLKREAAYVPSLVELEDGIKVRKIVDEYTPEIDWSTLSAEFPELYDKLAKVVPVIQLNEEALAKALEKDPGILAALQRHMKVKKPVIKVTARKGKDD